jgi:CSLREA domain-containing protein
MVQKFICAAVIAASYLVICTCICAQAPNGTLTFGDVPDGTTATTANTGFGGVRVGTGGGGFTLQNPGESIGSGAELKGVAPNTGSVNSVGVTSAEFGTAAQVYTVQFDAYFSGGSSGTWYFFAGNGTSFGSAQSGGFTGTDVFTGVRFAFGFGGALTIASRGGTAWSNLAIQPMTQFNAYKITIVGNNSTSTVNYGVGQSLAPNRSDIWVGTTLVADEAAKAQLASATSINAFRFYGENSAGNVATIALDNISWWNTAVQPAAPSPGTLQFSSATYSGSESGGSIALTVTRTGGSSGSVGAQITQTDGTATGGGSLCNPSSGDDYIKATYAVIFGDGETSKTVNIPVCNDALDETDETFTATLGSVSGGATLGSQSSATVTIIDDDWTVTTAADTNDGLCDADCSLREAIAGAAPGDAIRFSSLFDSAQTIAVGGQLQITKPLTINGPGANLLTVDATGGTDGAFYISTAGGQTTTLSGMTITGTDTATGVGGAIKAYNGALILDGVHVKNSSAANAGGGVYIETATGSVVRRSTFSGNSANRCGGLMVFGGSATIENATFSGDSSAAGVGGGLCGEFNAALTVRNSTITNNTAATTGGGIRLQSGSTLDIGGTIVAGNNSTGGQPEIQNDGSATSSGYNLIGDSSGDAADTVNAIGYQLTDIPDTNPMLQPLGYYFGGKIPAHTLYIGSQAFDHGSSFGLATDALGNARIVDHPDVANTADGADIGAVESRAPTAANTTVSGRVRTESGAGIGNARVTISGPGLSSPVTVITNNFGHFRFDQIQAGQTYVVSVSAKRYTFSPPSRAVSVQQDVTGIDFTAER